MTTHEEILFRSENLRKIGKLMYIHQHDAVEMAKLRRMQLEEMRKMEESVKRQSEEIDLLCKRVDEVVRRNDLTRGKHLSISKGYIHVDNANYKCPTMKIVKQ